jgi:septal ring factor EnvC (AmiA/AmiB activator)
MIPLLLAAALAQSLPEVRDRLSAERTAAEQLAGREASILGRLADLERQIELEGRALRAAQLRLRAATQRLTVVEERSQKAQAELDAAMAAAGPRLVARYRLGREGYVRFLLGAKSIADLLRRHRVFSLLLESDLETVNTLRVRAEAARAARDELAAAHAERQESAGAEEQRRTLLEATLDGQRSLLASVQREKGAHEEAARELEEAAKELAERLAEIRRTHPMLVAPEILLKASIRKARGKLPFPVDQGTVEARFGRATDPRFGTVTLHTGIDIRAERGSPVRAVWDGKVAHAGWFRGFGNLLIIDHGAGIFSLMAHLDQLEKALGDSVGAGEEVGTVGDSGSLKGAYLYFELRDGQKPLDPERWLSRSRKAPPLLAGAKGGAAR